MQTQTMTMTANDGKDIFVYAWLPEDTTQMVGVLQIAHGMAEHAKRYEHFASFLTDAGVAVYANDHRGHGKTAGAIENLGNFGDKDGWELVLGDMHALTRKIKEKHPDIPVFLMGHSMGSFFTRDYISRYGNDLKGVIISGTAGPAGVLGKIGSVIAGTQAMVKGKKSPSPLMTTMSFGSFNKPFKPNKTEFDWLSSDEEQVAKYVNDPMCGTVFSAGFFADLLKGISHVDKQSTIDNVPKNLPVHFISGGNCPVGNQTKGVKKVYAMFDKAGIEDLSCKFYDGLRHEMINEVNKDEVYRDILAWIKSHV